ncbi:hypothetical protein EJ05DRAFT_75016 [Pseudovirgaria hyperparasitica]|uniref:Cupin 2 conserved barrel domain-containing protein n=1 Tax=Pseudovirgaria hyperparasitica TaxID=470096 RepID=A0A6A6W6M9_9PEZI|nr:uncharacterized protein EJ05DRAFT_75016 [Pseudovirgaria hyperparasitica]KAF2756731.1 hypothetical protein EJ05DRAFT_75016 [Pseudovirgaria hyperparasitica]
MASSTAAILPRPRRVIASNLPLSVNAEGKNEPGVEVRAEVLPSESLFGGTLIRHRVGTHRQVPSSNDGSGELPLDDIPGAGIALPGGLNIYYLDIAPRTVGVMHRTTSTDYVIVLNGTLTLTTPDEQAYSVIDGKPDYSQPVETLCKEGEVIVQRGMMHAISNHTDEWVRALGVVIGSEPNRVSGETGEKVLNDVFLNN